MSDVESVLSAYSRVHFACRARRILDPGVGRSVTAQQAEILAALDEHDPAMVGELAEHLGVTPSTMSITLGRLEREGLLRREPDPSDRRVRNVRLTAAGATVRDARRMLDPDRVSRLLDLLRPEERAQAVRGLGLLAAAANELLRRGREQVAIQLGRGTP